MVADTPLAGWVPELLTVASTVKLGTIVELGAETVTDRDVGCIAGATALYALILPYCQYVPVPVILSALLSMRLRTLVLLVP